VIDPVSRLAALVSAAVVQAFGQANVDPAVRRSTFADYQADVAMRLARTVKKPPLEVAHELVEVMTELDRGELCETVVASAPGFVNVTLRREVLGAEVAAIARDERAGVKRSTTPAIVVIDYSAPNAAKEMHVGHLRSTVIGDCLARLLGFLGHQVVRQNHVGDWGTPFGMLVEHLVDLRSETASDLGIGELNAFYRAARRKFDDDAEFRERARRRVVLLQAGDEETLALWRTIIAATYAYFRDIYRKLGVLLDDGDVRGESFYNPALPDIAAELERRGIARVDGGALCVFLPEFKGREGDPVPLIVRKQDGGFGYAATDLAAIRFRVDDLGASRLLYVVGAPQRQHLAMVFATARLAGWLPDAVHAEHVAFGSVLGADRKTLRTRSGDNPMLVELLDEAIERAEAAVREKNPALDDQERAEVAAQVGIGALKYADLSSDRNKDYVFDWARMLSFEGNTGPYLQYASARIGSIVRRAAADGISLASALLRNEVPEDGRAVIDHPSERALALALIDFAGAVDAAAAALQPHRLCAHLYELATRFTAFYESCPVLRADTEEQRDSRLLLCAATQRTLAVGLDLLGIGVPERM